MQVYRVFSHGDKLKALLGNPNLPATDRPGVAAAVERYEAWVARLRAAQGDGRELLAEIVGT